MEQKVIDNGVKLLVVLHAMTPIWYYLTALREYWLENKIKHIKLVNICVPVCAQVYNDNNFHWNHYIYIEMHKETF